MPPRLDLFTVLRRRNGPSSVSSSRPLTAASSIASRALQSSHGQRLRTSLWSSQSYSPYPRVQPPLFRHASTQIQRRKRLDPYYEAQARAKKLANLSRQEVLREERSKAFGDPVRGVATPYVESFDTANPPPEQQPGLAAAVDQQPRPGIPPEHFHHDYLNHFVTGGELRTALASSDRLTSPYLNPERSYVDPAVEQASLDRHARDHENATTALTRIMSLENASAKDRLRTNIQRCIETFGRHNTDNTLQPKPASNNLPQQEANQPVKAEKTPRAGPDTGSSEVQVAILTAKIRSLANFLDTRGKKDKVNKRNLRLLVHRRQKLLRYLRKRERGGERWQHLVQTLGLSDGTWQGEISL